MFRGRRSRPRRTWPQRLVLGLNIVIVLTALASAAVLAYAKETVSSIPRVAIGNVLDPDVGAEAASGEPVRDEGGDEADPVLNFLLVGVDDVTGLPSDHILRQTRSATQLTDTMVIFRIDPNTGTASVMSIPRDLWVPINGAGSEKLNAALALGGPEALVTSIQDALGIPIHRYVQVNFAGFLELMRVIGGVNVVIDAPLADKKAQLDISETGCVNLSPAQALSYVRSRNLHAFIDGRWVLVDGRGDLGRIERQQDFLVTTLDQSFAKGFSDPGVLKGILDDVLGGDHIVLGPRITPQELLDFASAFRNFEDDDIKRYSLPVTVGTTAGRSVVFLNEEEAQPVLAVFRGPGAQDRIFRLSVRNGTLTAGLARDVGEVLRGTGFNVVEEANADRFDYATTTIRFDSTQSANAVELERWLQSGAVLEQRPVDTGVSVELIIGDDWLGVRDTPAEPSRSLTADGDEQLAVGPAFSADPLENTDAPQATPTPTPPVIASIRGC